MTRDTRIPPSDECVLRPMLDKWADRTPDKVFVVFEDGEQWTYAETRERVRSRARALRSLGVKQGEHVLVWLPNGPECLVSWFAINYLGAVYVPINTAYRGGVLEHAISVSDARLGIVHAELLPRLESLRLSSLATVVSLHGAPSVALPGITLLGADALAGAPDVSLDLEREIEPWDTQCIIFTSGTTGPSKGVMTSYLQLHESGKGFPLANASDRHMVPLPLFHAGSTIPIYLMLELGASFVLVSAFRTDEFWQVIERTGTTSLILLGVMAGFVVKRPAAEDPKASPLRWVMAVPLDDDGIEFGRRFKVDVATTFNMTEVSCPLVSGINPTLPGSCGGPRAGVEARLVDENDCEVAVGEIGELIVRTDTPWAMNSGYYKSPEATARAWRNGWFHTGDAFRKDAQGNYFFVDRMKDAIRRRGENISSFEVESEVIAHPAIRECAAVAVASEIAEDEVLVAVSLGEGSTLDPAELIGFLRDRMAHFMIPRYVRIMDELPKTPTQKVQKHLIRKEGITADTWDREAAGIVVKSERLSGAKR
ncbi:MAG TPA: AMP-binding protein [Quisquiliibacterium sp.]|nr:AMP-binding protein [Quisquiliibacterium sp.]